ncbi:hypothetical protein MSG28_010728 [Choristoneura fumiferana]|uniref:Uncharacterized protein n=1 Tax=Choristoneura fumiferana TaxID=7141 RepID=A0ACC0KNE4_CHOFU|nr:hypothetical protein MSG28_010728 [Choristoneura fumiferana]
MMSLLLRLTLFLVVLNQLLSPCEAYGSSGGKGSSGKYGGKPYYNPMRRLLMGTSAGIPGHTATRRGLGISAWGIVIVILALILGGMGFYYFSMCYPILCKKERNYDMIQLQSVAV